MSNDVAEIVVGNPSDYSFETCQTRTDRYGPFIMVDVLYAIAATKGNWAEMATLLGRQRYRIKAYVESHPEVNDFRNDVIGGLIDQIEYKHFDLALAGDGSAQRYVLSTLGKDRGYVQRQENVNKNVSDPNDPIMQLLNAIASRNQRLVTPPKIIEGEATEIENEAE